MAYRYTGTRCSVRYSNIVQHALKLLDNYHTKIGVLYEYVACACACACCLFSLSVEENKELEDQTVVWARTRTVILFLSMMQL